MCRGGDASHPRSSAWGWSGATWARGINKISHAFGAPICVTVSY